MGLIILICVFAIVALAFLVFCKVYALVTLGRCVSTRKLHGKTALITGGNRGIGYFTALDLAKRGARVIITSEDEQAVIKAKEQLIKETGNKNIVAKFLDLRSLEITRTFARDILATEDRLDILVNNAGTAGLGTKLTKDGIIPGLQVNYFGPFLLTNLLLGLLKKSAPSRIVNVASCLSQTSWLNAENINSVSFENNLWNEWQIYGNSKLCVVYATMEMAKRLKGSGVTVNCLHPGAVYTTIFNTPKSSLVSSIANILGPIYFKTPQQGAETTIHLAVSEEVEGVTGKYFSDCCETNPWINKDEERIKKIWDKSMELVKLNPKEMHYDD